ncbi:MAG: hypothetical protein ABW120_03935 [Sedimenticola sp.]
MIGLDGRDRKTELLEERAAARERITVDDYRKKYIEAMDPEVEPPAFFIIAAILGSYAFGFFGPSLEFVSSIISKAYSVLAPYIAIALLTIAILVAGWCLVKIRKRPSLYFGAVAAMVLATAYVGYFQLTESVTLSAIMPLVGASFAAVDGFNVIQKAKAPKE